jgi:two-component system chemotaxis sensor kinase CheA
MSFMNEEFFKELLGMFKMESEEHVTTILGQLNTLNQEINIDKKMEILEVLHRSAHSLKGAARTIGLVDIEPVCQSLEFSFSNIKRDKLNIPPELNSLIQDAVKELGEVLSSLDEKGHILKDKSRATQMIEDISLQVSALNK